MHDYPVCSNSNCRCFRVDFAKSTDRIREENINIEQIIITQNGLPTCGNCGVEISWEIENCCICGVPFGKGSWDNAEEQNEKSDLPNIESANGGETMRNY